MRQHSTQPPSLLSSRLCPQRSTFHGHLFLENIESDALSTPDTGRNDMLPWLVTQPYMYVLHGTAAQRHLMTRRIACNNATRRMIPRHGRYTCTRSTRLAFQNKACKSFVIYHHIISNPAQPPPQIPQTLHKFSTSSSCLLLRQPSRAPT